jgi:hypothetical protein
LNTSLSCSMISLIVTTKPPLLSTSQQIKMVVFP